MSLYQFSRYEIQSKIKRGGMAAVFLAFDTRFKRDVALKVLPPEFSQNPSFRARFEREAQTIAALEHPAIVPVYDFGNVGNLPFLVMRYLPGGSLADRLTDDGLDLSETIRIITQLAPAMDEVHRQGIVHRDLKPSNILFDLAHNPFITDFGIVKLIQTDETLTSTGTVIGTPFYMSPEQARGDSTIDGRSDIYSFGVMIFQMLAGELPFQSDTPMGIALKHIVDPVPNILEVKPDLPDICRTIIDIAMAKEPEDRYPTTSALATALSEVANASKESKSIPIVSSPITTPKIPEPDSDTDPLTPPPNEPESTQNKALRHIYELDDPVKFIFARSELISMGNDAMKPLTETLVNGSETSIRSNSASILKLVCEAHEIKSLARARTIKALTKALSDPEVAVRYRSLETLSIFTGKGVQLAIEPVGTLLGDPDPDVRQQAERTLKAIGGKRARQILNQHKGKKWF